MAILDKGVKNVEILKQNQYTPYTVEKQVAIIYCGTKGLLENVPVEQVKEFERDFLQVMELDHKDTLDAIAAGNYNDDITKVLEETAKKVALSFK